MNSALVAEGAVAAAPFAIGDAAAETGSSVGFEQVTVAYRGTVVLHDFTLTVNPGEFVALLGPSGSGKTTALKAIAGFVQPTRGRLRIGGEDVTAAPPYARGIGMVVQSYALFPHMTVADNVAFGLRARRASRELIAERVGACLELVHMERYSARYPRELSGGQQQRVAIARALAIRPRVLLLDEPLSALDAQIRRAMVEELARLHRELPHLTVLYVTHDQAEALTLADRIAILRDGKLSAYAGARMLYYRPPNRFTAEFLGRANLLPVQIVAADADTGTVSVRLGAGIISAFLPPGTVIGGQALLCLRPHDLKLQPSTLHSNAVEGTLQTLHWQGETQTLSLETAAGEIRVITTPLHQPPESGSKVVAYFAPADAVVIPDDPLGNG